MAISNEAHILEENKLRNLLERIAEDLNLQGIGNFYARTSSFDKKKMPKGLKEMDYIVRRNDYEEEEIVFGVGGRILKGLEGNYIMAYFFDEDVQQTARKHLQEYTKKEGIKSICEKFTDGKF